MIARLLTILALTLPVGACATQPAAPQDGRVEGARAAPGPAAPAPATAPATAPAPAAQAATPTELEQPATAPAVGVSGARSATPAPAPAPRPNGRAVASSGTPSAAAPATTPAEQNAAGQGAPLGSTPVQETPATAVPGTAVPGTAAPAAGPATMPSATPTANLLQTLFALVAVLALLAGLAWFLKRYGPRAGGGTANLRIVGSLNLGGRERLLVVEVGDQWIVVGASPGRVNALATMPRQEGADAHGGGATLAHGTNAAPSANSFADWLKQTIDKRK